MDYDNKLPNEIWQHVFNISRSGPIIRLVSRKWRDLCLGLDDANTTYSWYGAAASSKPRLLQNLVDEWTKPLLYMIMDCDIAKIQWVKSKCHNYVEAKICRLAVKHWRGKTADLLQIVDSVEFCAMAVKSHRYDLINELDFDGLKIQHLAILVCAANVDIAKRAQLLINSRYGLDLQLGMSWQTVYSTCFQRLDESTLTEFSTAITMLFAFEKCFDYKTGKTVDACSNEVIIHMVKDKKISLADFGDVYYDTNILRDESIYLAFKYLFNDIGEWREIFQGDAAFRDILAEAIAHDDIAVYKQVRGYLVHTSKAPLFNQNHKWTVYSIAMLRLMIRDIHIYGNLDISKMSPHYVLIYLHNCAEHVHRYKYV